MTCHILTSHSHFIDRVLHKDIASEQLRVTAARRDTRCNLEVACHIRILPLNNYNCTSNCSPAWHPMQSRAGGVFWQ